MKNEFMIYKEGTTESRITICSQDGTPFDRSVKIRKYLTLGYEVFDMDGNKITALQFSEGNTQLQKLIAFNERVLALYEEKFNREDWNAKRPEAVRWYNKCKVTAASEIFTTKQI